jgi:hypothetical protein
MKIVSRCTITALLAGLAGSALAGTAPASAIHATAASAVRPAAIVPRYITQGDTLLDKKTGLVWARCSVGQTWNGTGCDGSVSTFNFIDAQRQAKDGWRLPTLDELKSLVTASRVPPAINKVAFPSMDPMRLGYWSSTPDGDVYAWAVMFLDGRAENIHGDAPRAVRLIKITP